MINKALDSYKKSDINWDEHHKIAQEAAAECAVLLKNEEEILPLRKKANIAVLGGFAEKPHVRGGGSSGTNSGSIDVPLEFIEKYANVVYAKGYESETPDQKLLDEAEDAARGKEAVIVMIGTTDLTESEGCDRMDMKLPESHVALVKRASKVNDNIIVVNMSGAAVELREIDPYVKAILHMGLGGEGMGKACADLLFGEKNPSGKLSETFPVRIENTPAYPFYPGYNDNVVYHEELLVGYRYYDTKKIPVQYPFGYGLSYTQFEYSCLETSRDILKNGEQLKVSVKVKNTGNCAGKEIVQFYVNDVESYMPRPEKELKGFVKVELLPCEEKEVSIILEEDAFSYYVPHLHRFVAESGEFLIMAGSSSQNIRLQKKIVFESKDDVRLPFTEYNTLGEYYSDDRYEKVAKKVYEKLGITEDHFMFPIMSSITVKQLPIMTFVSAGHSDKNITVSQLQKCLVENCWIDEM